MRAVLGQPRAGQFAAPPLPPARRRSSPRAVPDGRSGTNRLPVPAAGACRRTRRFGGHLGTATEFRRDRHGTGARGRLHPEPPRRSASPSRRRGRGGRIGPRPAASLGGAGLPSALGSCSTRDGLGPDVRTGPTTFCPGGRSGPRRARASSRLPGRRGRQNSNSGAEQDNNRECAGV
jgi:hypothetical protein